PGCVTGRRNSGDRSLQEQPAQVGGQPGRVRGMAPVTDVAVGPNQVEACGADREAAVEQAGLIDQARPRPAGRLPRRVGAKDEAAVDPFLVSLAEEIADRLDRPAGPRGSGTGREEQERVPGV